MPISIQATSGWTIGSTEKGGSGKRILEREDVRDQLIQLAEEARSGKGSISLIIGEDGSGKTMLLDSLPETAEVDHLRLTARCSPLDSSYAFGVLRQLLDPVFSSRSPEENERLFAGAAGLSRGLFSDEPLPSAEPEHSVLNSAFWLFSNLADETPIHVLIDDLQWADEPTLRLLEFLGRRIGDLPICVTGTVQAGPVGRDGQGERGRLIDSLTTVADPVLTLEPLSEQAIETMFSDAMEQAPGPEMVHAAAKATGGSPALVEVLCREASARELTGTPITATLLSQLVAGEIAPRVESVLEGLTTSERLVATAVALLGDRASV
ncbi:MAG: AAA family ATPase, partial [Actinomycetota bacterium]|nr:AAA family ATPase [Actinomycetota bacterium]